MRHLLYNRNSGRAERSSLPSTINTQAGSLRSCWSIIVLMLLLISAPAMPSRADTTNISCEWLSSLQAQLETLGLQADATNTSQAVVLGLVQQVDKHARIISTNEWAAIQNQREGLYPSVGLTLWMTNGLPMIKSIASNAPVAGSDDIAVGDLITGVGTQRFSTLSLPDAQALLRPDNDDPVVLHILHRQETNKVEAARVLLEEPAIESAEVLPNNVSYIKINGLYKNSGRDIVSRLRGWAESKTDGIILDLRGAGGADTMSVTQVASLFSRAGQFLFAFRDLHQQDLEVIKALEGEPISPPLMILIDQRTTGAAEVLAAVLNGVARQSLTIGEATRGDFMLRESVDAAGHTLLVAVKALDTADGIRYNGKFGLQPAVPVDGIYRNTHDYEPPENLLDHREKLEIEGRDLETRRRLRGDGVLERSIDILTGLKSLNKADSKLSSPDSL